MFKNNTIKKYLSSVLAIITIVFSMSISMFAYADGDIAINKANFSDDIWRGLVADYIDPNRDGYLTRDEISDITLIDVSGFLEAEYGENTFVEIADLSGIEHFTSLRTLRVGGIGLEALNVYPLVALTNLTCQGNYLEELNLINNSELRELNCSANFLSSLELSLLPNLTKLVCHSNEIKSINLSSNPKLEYLSIFQNELTQLDISSNPLISTLNCSNNHLKTLDLSANPLLADVVESSIGNQTISASANYSAEDGSIYADVEIPNYSRIVSTSVDRVEEVDGAIVNVKGYDGTSFVTYEPEQILGGIDYYYNVNLEGADNMSVHIDVERDFYVVRYYDSESLENKIGEEIVNGGNAATFELSEMPQCKQFIRWDKDLSNITQDVQTFAVWQEDHNIKITSFENGVAHIECTNGCGFSEDYTFMDSINARENDINYVSYLDLNSDGIINAKDYSMLIRGIY
ncbi:MAG: hypothetical protein IJR70_04035 [Eubacterium sp.]|nr:hypothetical protein [Eubacterium sp.]